MTDRMIEPDLSKGVTIRIPREGEPFRCNPDQNSQFPAWVIKVVDDGVNRPEFIDDITAPAPADAKYYVIGREFLPTFEKEFPGKAKPVVMHMCMNPEGEVFFWPVETESDTAA